MSQHSTTEPPWLGQKFVIFKLNHKYFFQRLFPIEHIPLGPVTFSEQVKT